MEVPVEAPPAHVAVGAVRKNVVVLSDFEVGDRVAFVQNEKKQFQALLSNDVFLSEECCAAFAAMKLPSVFCGVVVAKPEPSVAKKDNYLHLPVGSRFVELTVVLDH